MQIKSRAEVTRFIRFLVAGIINTVIGYGVFLVLYSFLGVTPELANAVGYAVALVVAFMLNWLFVFSGSFIYRGIIIRFGVAFLLAFAFNQAVLIVSHRTFGIRPEIAQLLAMASYTVLFYFLNKKLVFHRTKDTL